ncbi:MAG: UDP-N-acetylglucosamine 2-epimerase (non-hydrolyzing) [Candidatus Stahlbacteria bacterium]|nr:UDP-N-acetylglucosamine 2-epimerase (non-hydrolyzing) [Candidatus Stahlbacteria bacterium]
MKRLKTFLVSGARPNFMKIAPLLKEMKRYADYFDPLIIHTGQHYDYALSEVFFKDLELPSPDIYLGIGSGTHSEQTGKIMIEFEKLLLKDTPDLVVVVGDVNSTIACALATIKYRCTIKGSRNTPPPLKTLLPRDVKSTINSLDYPLIVHIEAGLRSFDRTMPEEVNRVLTDAISDMLFTPSPDADENLLKEGIAKEKIYLVGDIMVDSLLANKDNAQKSDILNRLGLKEYAVLTLHRPSNVDAKDTLLKLLTPLKEVAQKIPIVYPAHPRTHKKIIEFGLSDYFIKWNGDPISQNGLYLLEPLGYLDFLSLEMRASFVLTDSGGIQEETTVLDIPCLTLRNTTERPITVTLGTNILVWNDYKSIILEADKILTGERKRYQGYKLWDGKTAQRIVKIMLEQLIPITEHR